MSVDKVRERAYLLWQRDGCPLTDGLYYWLKAEKQLQFRQRTIRSGNLMVQGNGPTDELVGLALAYAITKGFDLAGNILIEEDDGTVDTIQINDWKNND